MGQGCPTGGNTVRGFAPARGRGISLGLGLSLCSADLLAVSYTGAVALLGGVTLVVLGEGL